MYSLGSISPSNVAPLFLIYEFECTLIVATDFLANNFLYRIPLSSATKFLCVPYLFGRTPFLIDVFYCVGFGGKAEMVESSSDRFDPDKSSSVCFLSSFRFFIIELGEVNPFLLSLS
jgi:hypothetical protein